MGKIIRTSVIILARGVLGFLVGWFIGNWVVVDSLEPISGTVYFKELRLLIIIGHGLSGSAAGLLVGLFITNQKNE